MIIFFITICVLIVLTLAVILPKALRSSHDDTIDQLDTNVAIAREQRDALLQANKAGTIDAASFEQQIQDIELSLANAIKEQDKTAESSRSGWFAAGLIALFIPITSGALYLNLGTPQAVDAEALNNEMLAAQAAANPTPPAGAIDELLPALEEKLKANPNDVQGWTLLGNSYLSIGNYDKAIPALARANELQPGDTELLTKLAEATALARGGDLSGEPTEYLRQALQANPANPQAIWLIAVANQQIGKHNEALAQLDTLRQIVGDNPEALSSIDSLVARSREALAVTGGENNTDTETSSATTTSSEAAANIKVTVTASEAALAASDPEHTVFIFARASQGPPMPLAVARVQVKDLPVTVELNDSMAMMPAMKLSQFPNVLVGARISKTGNAIAEAGDWFAEQDDVSVADTADLSLTISQQK
jgi:cytochrome c-type biogenesis protein CcmH